MTKKLDITSADYPDAYKKGFINFHGAKFITTPDALIPRYETEQIPDDIVEYVVSKYGSTDAKVTILELGTGNGCISLTLARLLPNAKIIATEICDKALNIAKKNAKYHKLEDRVEFIQKDLLDGFHEKVDILVANLPYIPSARIPTLEKSVVDFEPIIALDGGEDGFEIYRRLFKQMVANNVIPRLFFAEIDEDHIQIAIDEAYKHFPNAEAKIVKDFFKYDRFLYMENPTDTFSV